MAVFFDTGGGDIYAGETREQVLAAIKADGGEAWFAEIEHEIFEVDGSYEVMAENEDGSNGAMTTLAELYTDIGGAYCIASSNC